SSITPDTAYSGSAFALTLRGGGLVSTSIVNRNGAPRPTTWTDGTLVAQIAASDVAASGSASITVTNPSPGGGTSAAASLRIVERPPRITAFGPPVTLVAGSGARTVTITGTAFNASSTVRVDGQAHQAQFVSTTAMSLPLSASEVASPRSIAIQVVNPGESGPSNVAVLPVLPTGASMDVTAVIQLPNNAIIYDPQRRVLYASIPTSVPTRGNTITKIDPVTGAIGASVDVGADPGRMAISDDARFLYVILNGAPSVVRVDLMTFTKDIEIPLTGTQPMRGNDVAVIPGAPRSVVIARRTGGSTSAGVAIYDDAAPRPLIDNEFSGPDRLAITATRIYGVNTATSANGLQWLDITPSGVRRAVQTIPPVGICCEIRLDAGRLYTSSGRVVDPEKMTIYGTLSEYGEDDVRPDAARGRVHTIGVVGGLRTYETTSLTLIGSNANQQLFLLRKLVRFDVDGLAVGGGERIVILRGSLIGP
ncbi:MAG TPA: IPT/TIG domain-containing protein, partial [Gemmatimonadaceae bacterium]